MKQNSNDVCHRKTDVMETSFYFYASLEELLLLSFLSTIYDAYWWPQFILSLSQSRNLLTYSRAVANFIAFSNIKKRKRATKFINFKLQIAFHLSKRRGAICWYFDTITFSPLFMMMRGWMFSCILWLFTARFALHKRLMGGCR
jgi:hypothetical protein